METVNQLWRRLDAMWRWKRSLELADGAQKVRKRMREGKEGWKKIAPENEGEKVEAEEGVHRIRGIREERGQWSGVT